MKIERSKEWWMKKANSEVGTPMTADRYTAVLIRGACLVYLWKTVFNSEIFRGFMKGLMQ